MGETIETRPAAMVGREGGWVAAFWGLVTVCTLSSLWMAGFAGLDLVPDEAYYWVWSKHLDWCYFSKGPGIAVLIRLGTWLAGDTELGVRLPALVCSAATAVTLFYWVRSATGSARLAFWSVLCLAAAPLMTAGRMLATIDAPLFMCWTIACALFWRLTGERGGRRRDWLLLGAVVGLGALVKWTMLFFVPTVAAGLWALPAGRRRLKGWGPWLGLAAVIICLIPALVWNAEHGWITLRHNLHKAEGRASDVPGVSAVVSAAGQMAVFGPVLFVLIVWAVAATTRRALKGRERTDVVLAAAWTPVLGFYAVLGLFKTLAPNWPAVGYATAVVAVAREFAGSASRRRRRWLVAAVIVSVLVQVPFLAGDLVYRIPWEPLQQLDQASRLMGWRALGLRLRSEADAAAREVGPERVIIAGKNYQYTSELRFYAGGGYRVLCVPSERVVNQYGLWPEEPIPPGSVVLFCARPGPEVLARFEKVETLEPFVLKRGL